MVSLTRLLLGGQKVQFSNARWVTRVLERALTFMVGKGIETVFPMIRSPPTFAYTPERDVT